MSETVCVFTLWIETAGRSVDEVARQCFESMRNIADGTLVSVPQLSWRGNAGDLRRELRNDLALVFAPSAVKRVVSRESATAFDVLVNAIEAIVDKHRVGEDCYCSDCQKLKDNAEPTFVCPTCGYHGRPAAMECECLDYGPCSSGLRRGGGCCHGNLICPICDEGDASVPVWEIVKSLRAARDAIFAGATTEAKVSGGECCGAPPKVC